jgi:hypothetical protein
MGSRFPSERSVAAAEPQRNDCHKELTGVSPSLDHVGMVLRGDIPTGSKVIIEPNDITNDDVTEGESIVDIKVTQPKEVVLSKGNE